MHALAIAMAEYSDSLKSTIKGKYVSDLKKRKVTSTDGANMNVCLQSKDMLVNRVVIELS